MEQETVQLWFQPGNRREGYRWSAAYDGKMVGLCTQPLCDICDRKERQGLRGFRGGRIEVQLTLHKRPSFWEAREFYLGHLKKVLPSEAEAAEVDEGFEFDVSKFNTIICATPQGVVVIDPGSMGFDNDEYSLSRFISGKKIIATVVTHGHLDHLNFLGEITRGQVFMSQIAFQLASRHAYLQRDDRLVEALRRAKMVVPGEPILLNSYPLKVETFPLAHSIPETMGLAIRGQRLRFVHLGDFKLNGVEARTKAEVIGTLARVAREPVDVLSLSIINAHIKGFTPLEALVIDAFTNILAEVKGRVIVSCFASNLERIKKLTEAAGLLDRPVAFYGAGMHNSQELLGIRTEEGSVNSDRAVFFVTGCQGEENSVLWRIAKGRNPAFAFRSDDTLVFSARCIPGNEIALFGMLTKLRPEVGRLIVNEGEIEQVGLRGLGVEDAMTHVSGHEQGDGIRLVLKILRPKKVLPLPQTSPQKEAFQAMAQSLGIEVLDEMDRVIEV